MQLFCYASALKFVFSFGMNKPFGNDATDILIELRLQFLWANIVLIKYRFTVLGMQRLLKKQLIQRRNKPF